MDIITTIFDALTTIINAVLGTGESAYDGIAGALSSVVDASSTTGDAVADVPVVDVPAVDVPAADA